MTLPPHPIHLSYADALCRRGLTVERTPDGVRIEFPRGMMAPIWGAFAVIFVIGSILLLLFRLQSNFWILTALAAWPLWAWLAVEAIAVVIATAWREVRYRRVVPALELNAHALIVRRLIPNDSKPERLLPRSKVYEVKYVSHSGKLVIRCRGEEMIELRPMRDPIVLSYVADVLHESLELEPQRPAAGQS